MAKDTKRSGFKSGSPSTKDSTAAGAIKKGLKGKPLKGTRDGRGGK